ncbi:serine/threonine transporter SstT [Kurthia massiliensis]|uniref:serine/threonine transporter SstT n=1 Tax=Kurthia massiliensis TaxID=1033739 RepID=UPI000289EFDA|nr:serine/threonine transporter SstT [Kurthia massiliensis]
MKSLFSKWQSMSLVKRIIVGLVVGILLALAFGDKLPWITLLGTLFVSALKAVAPYLVLILVVAAIAMHEKDKKTNMKTIIGFYAVGTVGAAISAVVFSFLFPSTIQLQEGEKGVSAPGGVTEVVTTLLNNIVSNPLTALTEANYIGILAWALVIGIAAKSANEQTKAVIQSASDIISKIVKWVIDLAPFGIMGIVYNTVATTGLSSLKDYGQLLIVLVSCMAFVALVLNPIIVFVTARRNPYPLIFTALRESGVTAFFTRSSAANIPVNLELCRKLGLNKDTYAVSIPLGAATNTAGAAVTITVLTLAAAHTLNVDVDMPTAILLSIVSSISAAGASGIAGGSLLLIPLACGLLGIPNDIAMQVVAVGFVIGVIQDSCETAVNSHSDIVFTAAAEYMQDRKKA